MCLAKQAAKTKALKEEIGSAFWEEVEEAGSRSLTQREREREIELELELKCISVLTTARHKGETYI